MNPKQGQSKDNKYDLSVIIIFYNMAREARRTLFSLSREYQRQTDHISYEVIVVDNGSPEPLERDWVDSLGDNFRYIYLNTNTISPCKALNYGVEVAKSNFIMLCIDGARILSPGILNYSMLATKLFGNPFIYTIGMHIGHKTQNYLAEENYNQLNEDKLLASFNWEKDGYVLFDVSSVALSSKRGYLSRVRETNCVTLLKSTYLEMEGFDEKFVSAGGGLANLDFFNRANQNKTISPVMLLGEATFHQFHGGTATNVPLKDHPWERMAEEYQKIRDKPFETIFRFPVYFGEIHPKSQWLFGLTG
jgi:glycosyltransferase involved in cell wall biosynthesis